MIDTQKTEMKGAPAYLSGRESDPSDLSLDDTRYVSLCEALDRILNKGAVITGEVTISVANIDLLYLGLQVILTSIKTAREMRSRYRPRDTQGDMPEAL